jgi:iron complex transport system ATP-binding protein
VPVVADVVIDVAAAVVTRGGKNLIDKVDWRVEEDERWVVLGPNGAGKTTLLNLVSAQLHPTRGVVRVLGEKIGRVDVFELRTRIGMASVAVHDRIPPQERVLDVVMTAAWSVVGRFREGYEPQDERRARNLLDQLGVPTLAERDYGTLS